VNGDMEGPLENIFGLSLLGVDVDVSVCLQVSPKAYSPGIVYWYRYCTVMYCITVVDRGVLQ
jgi:hypothetical protein